MPKKKDVTAAAGTEAQLSAMAKQRSQEEVARAKSTGTALGGGPITRPGPVNSVGEPIDDGPSTKRRSKGL